MNEPLTAVLAIVIGVLVVGAIAYIGVRMSHASNELVKRHVDQVNRVFAEAAERTGLLFVAGGSWDHPLMGSIPAYGSLRGVLRGRKLLVSVVQSEDDATVTIEAIAEQGPALSRVEAPPAAATIAALGAIVRVAPDRVVVSPAAGSWSHGALGKAS